MAGTQINDDWKQWIRTNIQRGCSLDELFRILSDEGFEPDAIERELRHRPAVDLAKIVNPLKNTPPAPAAQARPSAAFAAVVSRLKRFRRFDCERIELYTAPGFLSPAECAAVVESMKGRLRESTITVPDEPDKYFRVSQTCDLGHIGNPAVSALDRKICEALGVGEALAEVTQGQHYEPGGEFKPHTDYFEAHELERFSTPRLGQRSWTFMIYLNEPLSGGETTFPNVGLSVKPETGMAVIWSNLRPDGTPNPDSLHHGTPVREGHKDIITKWFRVPR
jgi:prolyl 4-hydroxylase